MGELTDKQMTFCEEYLINGHNALKAYKKAYPDAKEESAQASASRLLENVKVSTYLNDARKENRRRARMSKDDKLGLLESIMAGENKNLTIKAIEVHNKMTGDNEAEKKDINVSGLNINEIPPKD